MAEDRLIFGIGFDLDDAVKDAEKDFGKVIKDLQTVANNKPLKLSVETDLKSIKAAEGSISALREEMARLSKAWNSITNTAKFNDDGTLTKEAKELADQYMAATNSMAKYGMTLEQITRERKQAIVDEQKAEEKRYQEWLRNKQQEATENERIERQKQAATARTIAEQNKEYARQAAAEEKRQAAISSSLRYEYKRIELKQQEEAASRRELQMLNERLRKEAQIAAATKNQSMQAAYNARRKAGLDLQRTLQAEENSIAAINAKLKIQRQRLNEVDMGSAKFNKIAQEVERLSKKLEGANNRVAQLTGQTVAGQKRITNAVNETNKAYSSTDGYISRLIKRTLVLFGIRQVMRFAERIREVTAEFELQRVSLGAIIQDTEKANALFNQIKTFAVQSPFEIKDLVSYVKQLSAYRIETDKLFDTTKRLADVSAGLGVDMSRLILAYGQVRAASVLRGQEVRQFTEAGIPLIELLAEKFTVLRGEMVSTSEVFDLISQRAVSFEMVAEIFEDMTNAGGMFYNMQEKQAQTLAGQWSNLKDSLSIMYDEMGNTKGVQAGLRGVISLTKTLAENWQLVEAYMIDIFGIFAIAKVIGAYKLLVNVVKKDVLGSYSQLKIAQREYNAAVIAERNLLITATQAERAAAQAKVQTTAATLAAAKATAQAARGTTVLTYAWKKLTALLKANWVGLLISALVVAYQTISHLVSKSNELKKALQDIGSEGAKNITVMTRNFELLANKAVQAADGSKTQKDALDELQRTYRDMIPTHLLTIENLRNMAGSYDILTTAIQEYCRQQMLANQIETIIGNTTEKISNAQTKLRKKLKDTTEIITTGFYGETRQTEAISLSFDERTIERAFAGIEKYARTTADSVEDIIRNAFKDFAGVELTDKEVQAIAELGGFANNMYTLVDAYREQETEIKRVTEQQKALTGEVGLYGDLIDAATEKINNFSDATLKVGTYEFDTAKAKAAADEYVSVIKRIFQDSGLTFEDAWVDGQFIDIDSINKALVAAGNKVSSQAHKAFGKIATAYYELVPSDVFSKAINKKFEDVARGMNVSMDLIKKYLKDSNTSIDDFVKNFFGSIDELEKKIQQTRGVLQASNLSESDRGKKSADLENYENELAVLQALIPYIQLFNVEKSKGGKGTDDRLSNLKEEVSLLEKVYNNYKKYTEYESKSKAQERINREFGETLKIFKQYGIELPKTSEEYQKALKKLQDVMRTLPKSQKDVLELGFKIENVDFEDSKKNLEKELKRLADEVSRTKVAKDFFDKMLNITGDRKLSASITMSVYGGTGDELKQRIIDQIRNAFKTTTGDELDLSLAINYNTLEVDYLKLAELAEKNKDILLEASASTRDGIIKAGLETTAARIAQWEKDIQKDQTYSEKRIRLAQETAQNIADIEVSNIPDAKKKRLQEGYRQREQEQAADLAWGAFKDSPIYVQMFDKLETASTTMLNAMLDKLKQLKAQWGESLSPTELKELQSRMNEIESQLANKNPFKTLTSAIKEYRTLTKEKSYKEAVQELADNMQKAYNESAKYAESLRTAQAAEQAYTDAVKQHGGGSEEAENAKKAADAAWEQARAQKDIADKAEDVAKKSQETVDDYKQCADKAKAAGAAIGEWTDQLNVAFDGIRNIMDAFGASEEDMQFFDDLVGGFNKVSQGAQQGAKAVASFMSGDIFGGITGVIGSIGSIISGFTDIFYAGRIRKANKEIKRQQEILDSLEHSYERLQKAADSLFDSKYVANFRKQQQNLRAQIVATEKQLEAEKSKGKKKDNNKIKDYEKNIQDIKDQLEDLTGTLSEQMLGSDLASAARSFAQAWLEAYKEFGDTRKAIEDEMQKMMENLIVESVLGAVMQKALEPVFEMIDKMSVTDFYDDNFWTKVVDAMEQSTDNALTGASVITAKLEKAGVNIRALGSEMSGISKDIATASEESILGLSSNILTQNYYISHIDTTVSQILAMMSGGGTEFSSNEQIVDLITIQNQHLAYLPNIALNTAQTAERCERAAAACENIAENLNRVIKPNGVQGSYRVNTSL